MDFDFLHKKQRRLRRLQIALVLVGILLIGTIGYAAYDYSSKQTLKQVQGDGSAQAPAAKQVRTMVLDPNASQQSTVAASGVAKPATTIDVVAQGAGTVSNVRFNVGDRVSAGQVLATLSEGAVSANYQNATQGVANLAEGLEATRALSEQTVRQAEVGVRNAEETVKAAEMALAEAQSTYKTTIPLHEYQTRNAVASAISAYHANGEGIRATLDDINYIIRAEGTRQLPDISSTLSINDPATLERARQNWKIANAAYGAHVIKTVSEENVRERLDDLALLLNQTLAAASDAVLVLQYTTPNFLFSESELEDERADLAGLKTDVAADKTTAANTATGLDTLAGNQLKERNALKNAIASAESRLAQSAIAAENAAVALAAAKRNRDVGLVGGQTSLDSARGQLSLAAQSLANLTIRAAISGTITKRSVEQGAEVAPGQKLGEISQTDLITIAVGLTPEDAYRIAQNAEVVIAGKFKGTVARISPAADAVSRKVTVEIAYDNSNGDLVPQTFVDVEIAARQLAAREGAFLVPLSAVTVTRSESFVFLVRDGRAVKTAVEIGAPQSAFVEVMGLAEGDELVVEGGRGLADGEAVYGTSAE